MGDLGGSIAFVEELLQLWPDHREAMLRLATLQLGQNPHVAASLASRLCRSGPDEVPAWTLLGQAVSALGRVPMKPFKGHPASAKLSPADAHAHSNLSVALLACRRPARGDRGCATRHFARPGCAGSICNLGPCAPTYWNARQKRSRLFSRRLVCGRPFTDALKGLARAQKNLGRPSAGILALLRAVEVSSAVPGLHFELATLYQDIGELHLAWARD